MLMMMMMINDDSSGSKSSYGPVLHSYIWIPYSVCFIDDDTGIIISGYGNNLAYCNVILTACST
jgi:hypothetical protein